MIYPLLSKQDLKNIISENAEYLESVEIKKSKGRKIVYQESYIHLPGFLKVGLVPDKTSSYAGTIEIMGKKLPAEEETIKEFMTYMIKQKYNCK